MPDPCTRYHACRSSSGLFTEHRCTCQIKRFARQHISASAEGATVLPLEADLQATRDRLQSTTEQLESSNEQLRSGDEELSSVNEELQSANEELETSREELRSTNEELQTVNSELKTRVDELSCANSDLVNLLECTQIAMFVVDRDFAVKSFTPAAKDLFHFVETDVGRSGFAYTCALSPR